MLFFGAVAAPLVFAKLPPAIAQDFIAASFRKYYAYVMICAAIAAFGLAARRKWAASAAMAATVLITLWLRFRLIPRMNALLAAGELGRFGHLHVLAVLLNGLEMLAAAVILLSETRLGR